MDYDNIFIPGQILTVLITLFSYIITHIPLKKKKRKRKTKLLILIVTSTFVWGFFWGGCLGVFCDRFSLNLAMCYIWLLGDFHPSL